MKQCRNELPRWEELPEFREKHVGGKWAAWKSRCANLEGPPEISGNGGGRLDILAGGAKVSKTVTHDFTTHITLSTPQISKN